MQLNFEKIVSDNPLQLTDLTKTPAILKSASVLPLRQLRNNNNKGESRVRHLSGVGDTAVSTTTAESTMSASVATASSDSSPIRVKPNIFTPISVPFATESGVSSNKDGDNAFLSERENAMQNFPSESVSVAIRAYDDANATTDAAQMTTELLLPRVSTPIKSIPIEAASLPNDQHNSILFSQLEASKEDSTASSSSHSSSAPIDIAPVTWQQQSSLTPTKLSNVRSRIEQLNVATSSASGSYSSPMKMGPQFQAVSQFSPSSYPTRQSSPLKVVSRDAGKDNKENRDQSGANSPNASTPVHSQSVGSLKHLFGGGSGYVSPYKKPQASPFKRLATKVTFASPSSTFSTSCSPSCSSCSCPCFSSSSSSSSSS
jgi:hypothetical protein